MNKERGVSIRYQPDSPLNQNALSDAELAALNDIFAPIAVLELNDADELVYTAFNHEACWAMNMSAAEVIGKTALEVYPQPQGRLAHKWHREAMSSGKQASYEFCITVEGRDRHIRTKLYPCLDSQGRFKRLIGLLDDLTHRPFTEDELLGRPQAH